MSEEHDHEMHCPECGSDYTLTDETLQWAVRLADYARISENEGVSAGTLQWVQDVGAATPEVYYAIVREHDRRVVKLFLRGLQDRRTRQAWRAVAGTMGVRAPFDVVSPEG